MKLLRYAIGIAAAAALLVVSSAPAFAQGAPPDTVDHYKVYRAIMTFDLNQPVFLQDQFGPHEMQVKNVEMWSNPVDKNHEGITRPDRHYSWWRVEPPAGTVFPTWDVVVGNQFGAAQLWKLGRPRWLMAPSSKNDPTGGPIPDGDHYLCYEALSGPVLQKPVDLLDQFGQRTAIVDTAKCLCNPVVKFHNGQQYPVRHPDVHLACYRIDPSQPSTIPGILFHDQFFLGQLPLQEDLWVCVPSSKQIVTGVKASTWSRLRQLYR